LLITSIDILEEPKYYKDPPLAQINVTFSELMEMDKTELAPYPLQRIIVYLDGRGKSNDLIPFADEILTREGPDGKDVALYFKSASLAASGDTANQAKAIAGFTEVINKYQSQLFTDDATHALGMLHMKRKEWVAAENAFNDYVRNKRLNNHNPEVWYNLGMARESQKKFIGDGSAATAYSRCWSKYAGHFKFSCPAMIRSIEIERDYSKDGGKQKAYELSDSWLRSMAKYTEHPVAGNYLRKTADLRDELAADPSVTVKERK
ncbi:MAG: tetratricopeptide (TPR) repeat protein, partial [Verrucomicrobiales bacterium]